MIPHIPPTLLILLPRSQVLRTTATVKHGDPEEKGTKLRKTATTSSAPAAFVDCEGLDNGTRVEVLEERTVGSTELCLVDDKSGSLAGRGWVKKDYLSDIVTYEVQPEPSSDTDLGADDGANSGTASIAGSDDLCECQPVLTPASAVPTPRHCCAPYCIHNVVPVTALTPPIQFLPSAPASPRTHHNLSLFLCHR